nr:putative ribonuclease H-like domain-containing protein [Tanacetum cinerariifolium]
FSWVFFLASKDETTPVLKTFILGLENLLSLKVKVIRCDNRAEFKNSNLNQFCGLKDIKREFSVPRTPQQNGIAERKNRTLIEAAKTLLADSLLPIPFWAQAVNTACYVQYKVLVTKPHNKTPYELLHGRLPSIGFMRPFGCLVTILNTLDHLGKFQGKNKNKDALVDGKEHDDDIQKSVSPNIYSSSSDAQTRKQGDKTENKDKGKSLVVTIIGFRDLNAEFEECTNNISNGVNAVSSLVSTTRHNFINSTNDFSVAGPSNTAASPTVANSSSQDASTSSHDSDMLNLEILLTLMMQMMNKAKLVAQGHTQEEGIDYEEVFAPVARIEAIRLFLAYASFMGFLVYQMDVKSAFLYGTIGEEVYVCQPPGFEDPGNPDKVYKVVKALYGLHQAPRAWYETLANYLIENGFQRGTIDQTLFINKKQKDILLVQIYVDDIIFGLQVKQKKDGIFINQDKYVVEILRKFGLYEGESTSTLIDAEKPLLKDSNGEDVDVHTYRSMIGSLMYLTSSRPDIMFAVCACARFQMTSKVPHLNAVKRIFRYLKRKPYLGLWYPKDLPFDLVAYSDSDYASAILDRKSTTGGCCYLRNMVIEIVILNILSDALPITTNGVQLTISNPQERVDSP